MVVPEVSLERLVFHLNTLAELGEEVASPKDFVKIMRSSLMMVMGSFSTARGVILSYEREKKCFSSVAAKGIPGIKGKTLILSGDTVRALAENGKAMDLNEKGAGEIFGALKEELLRFGTKVASPLVIKGELFGVIAISEKVTGQEFTRYDRQLLSVMARHISHSLHTNALFTRLMHKYNENKGLYDNLSMVYRDTIHAFATAIDAKDAYTKGHSHRVSAYCAVVARKMGWAKGEVEGIKVAGLLHDIGKITVDKTIINKASPLSSMESRELNSHPVVGYEILSKIHFPWKGIAMMTRNHHEKVDGTGYPDRLERAEIPAGARVMALMDAFDAMTTDRPYRPRLKFSAAITEIKNNTGTQFEPAAVVALMNVILDEIKGEAERPTIMPLLAERLDAGEVRSLVGGFAARL
ncbi:MAG: HD-GYP domain-containing protein [Thermodesulfobacteriota bacterium]